MTQLYALSQAYAQLLYMEDVDPQTIADTLESIHDEIEDKAENIAKLIRSILVDAEAIKIEETRLTNRRKALENRATYLKTYLQEQMELSKIDKVKRPTVTISIQNNPPSVLIEDESLIPSEYMIPQADTIDKRTLLKDMKEGLIIEGCSITQTRGIRIK
jgi:transcriptional regulator of heat shock response